MVTYRKRKDSDSWHWCTNCDDWPTDDEDFDEIELPEGQRPSTGELDNQCRAKERDGKCSLLK